MPLLSTEEYRQAVKVRLTKRNLHRRQMKLVRKFRAMSLSKFRADPKLQTELRRVAALATKLGEHLHSALHDELIREVMES